MEPITYFALVSKDPSVNDIIARYSAEFIREAQENAEWGLGPTDAAALQAWITTVFMEGLQMYVEAQQPGLHSGEAPEADVEQWQADRAAMAKVTGNHWHGL